MRRFRTLTAVLAVGAVTATACTSSDDTSPATTAATQPSTGSSAATTTAPPTTQDTTIVTTNHTPDTSTARVAATVVRFSAGDAFVDVTMADDNATVRDFLSMLPLSLRFEEFNGREKISYLPRPLDTTGTTGSDPEDGDLIYYTPWGNLGFYYDAAGIGHSDDVIHLGTFTASLDQLAELERGEVTAAMFEQ